LTSEREREDSDMPAETHVNWGLETGNHLANFFRFSRYLRDEDTIKYCWHIEKRFGSEYDDVNMSLFVSQNPAIFKPLPDEAPPLRRKKLVYCFTLHRQGKN